MITRRTACRARPERHLTGVRQCRKLLVQSDSAVTPTHEHRRHRFVHPQSVHVLREELEAPCSLPTIARLPECCFCALYRPTCLLSPLKWFLQSRLHGRCCSATFPSRHTRKERNGRNNKNRQNLQLLFSPQAHGVSSAVATYPCIHGTGFLWLRDAGSTTTCGPDSPVSYCEDLRLLHRSGSRPLSPPFV